MKGLRVLVTAGAAGIGRAITTALVEAGTRVHICDVAPSAMHGVSSTLADVSGEADVDRLFDDVRKHLGGLDVLVNNAGIAGPTGRIEDLSLDDWRRTLDVDLTGQFLCARRAVPMLKEAGGGCIINMSSAAGRFGYAFRTPYAAAKWGVIGLTQSLAKELGPSNIRVNAILPGVIKGPRMEKVIRDRAEQTGVPFEAMEKQYLDRISLRRMTGPEDVAAMVVFLVSDAGRNISGQSLGVDGNVEAL
ncbi:MAG: SDR family oxidoreductase [Alphaproteobacteria bacterium]|nr:SDR family oxidoreductase [Alphaproteobacteria bacterium]